MRKYDEEFMRSVEQRFVRFMDISTTGIRKDYYRKHIGALQRELLYDEFPEDGRIEDVGYYDSVFSDSLDYVEDAGLATALKNLSPRQRDILFKTIVEGMTEKEAARLFKISQQGVSKTKGKAVGIIKRFMMGRDRR